MRKLSQILMWLGVLLLVACAGKTAPASPTQALPTATPLSGRITFAGSTTVQPLADRLSQIFQGQHPDVQFSIAAGGSTVGIQAIHDGTVDIGMASRHLKPEEATGIEQHQIAWDVLAVVVHPSNPVQNLSSEQLRDIYLGHIVNWREVGGADLPIVVVARDQNSGTRGAFDELVLGKQEPAVPGLIKALTAGDMAAAVAGEAGAIGYVGFGNIEPTLKVIAIDDVLPTEQNARSGSYKLMRPLLLLTGPLTQPLALQFVEFALSETGQRTVSENGWTPVK